MFSWEHITRGVMEKREGFVVDVDAAVHQGIPTRGEEQNTYNIAAFVIIRGA